MDSELICDYVLMNSNRELSQMELNVYVFLIDLWFYKEYGIHILKEEFEYHSLISWYLPYIKEKYRYQGAYSIDRPKYLINLPEKLSKFILSKIEELDKIPYWDIISLRNKILEENKE